MTTLDARGKSCPMPIVLTAKAMKSIGVGDALVVQADDRAFPEDVRAWCTKTGHELVSVTRAGDHFRAEIRRAR